MSGSHAHILTGEQSRLRRWTLFFFARYIELPLLRWGYSLLRGRYRRLGANRLVRALIGWGVAVPMGYLGDTARPVPYPQLQRMIDGLDGAIAVGPCRCRLSHAGCEHPLETDIVIRTGVEAWTRASGRLPAHRQGGGQGHHRRVSPPWAVPHGLYPLPGERGEQAGERVRDL